MARRVYGVWRGSDCIQNRPFGIKPVGVMIVALELLLNLGMSYWFT